MASNPLFQTNSSPNNSTQPTKSVNRSGVSVPKTHNTFDMSYFNFKSQRFGNYEPFFVMEGVSGDRLPFSNSHNVRSLPFASPILSTMKLNKDYFMIPNHAIQPNTWSYIFKNPVQGDDVPDDCQNNFPFFGSRDDATSYSLFEELCGAIINIYDSMNETSKVTVKDIVTMLVAEKFFSTGSLLYNLGYKINPIFTRSAIKAEYSFDSLFDSFFNAFEFGFIFKPDPDTSVSVVTDSYLASDSLSGASVVDKFTAVSLLRSFAGSIDYGSFKISFDIDTAFYNSADGFYNIPTDDSYKHFFRMDRVIAYQLACAQYYVNPQIDFIYNAQLYRDNYFSLLNSYVTEESVDNTGVSIKFFPYNGTNVPYDYFSSTYWRNYILFILDVLTSSSVVSNDSYFHALDLTEYIFGYRESLKFGDYFTDSRSQPLAFGEQGSDIVSVMDDSVSVIDISQKVVLQRFRNAVVKLNNSEEDYLRGIFGEDMTPDFHIPKFIVHTEFGINGEEISNTTSDDQGNIVTNLKSGADSTVFDIDVSMPCVILGISYVSIPRLYSQVKERFFFHEDRFDMFNPMLQYFGDQSVDNQERTDRDVSGTSFVFGYQSRNNEYKQRVSQVSGAFVNTLKSWVFVTDSLNNATKELVISDYISPSFIRAHDYEFNRFLARQTGLSLGSGFHFIMQYNNVCVCNRPMEVNPSTL